MRRWGNRRDEAEPAIVEALRAVGAYVALVSQAGLPDLFVLFRGQWYALEVKTGKGKSQAHQVSQRRFLELTGTPIVRTPYAALQAIGACQPPPAPLRLVPSPSKLGDPP